MKKLLKLYKMFYRLLRLKSYQRHEIEQNLDKIYRNAYGSFFADYHGLQLELADWKFVAHRFCIYSVSDLEKVLASREPLFLDTKSHIRAMASSLKEIDREEMVRNILSELDNESNDSTP